MENSARWYTVSNWDRYPAVRAVRAPDRASLKTRSGREEKSKARLEKERLSCHVEFAEKEKTPPPSLNVPVYSLFVRLLSFAYSSMLRGSLVSTGHRRRVQGGWQYYGALRQNGMMASYFCRTGYGLAENLDSMVKLDVRVLLSCAQQGQSHGHIRHHAANQKHKRCSRHISPQLPLVNVNG